jgi:hypothetical protein
MALDKHKRSDGHRARVKDVTYQEFVAAWVRKIIRGRSSRT